MKIKNLFFASLAALTFAACSNDDAPAPQAGNVVINFSTVSATTKAEGNLDLTSLLEESTISSGEVVVFDDKGQIVTRRTLSNGSVTIEGSALAVNTTYTFAGVANHTTTATTLEDLGKEIVTLGSKEDDFVMYGTVSKKIGEATEEIEIEVKRVLSGVQLLSIKSAFKAGTPDYAVKGEAKVKGLYLSETNPTAQLNGTPIAATEGLISGLAAEFNTKFTKDVTYIDPSIGTRAYACPGKAKYAVLTVEYSYGPSTYTRYYNIADKITAPAANILYGLNVTLTGPGSGDKEQPDEFGSAIVTMKAIDWYKGTVINVDQEN